MLRTEAHEMFRHLQKNQHVLTSHIKTLCGVVGVAQCYRVLAWQA
jgi:hypothetical protein